MELGFLELLAIAVGLSMDAFAVSLGAQLSGRLTKRAFFRLSFHFGLFQFMMPVIGWYLGMTVASFIKAVDYWIAFILLFYVGLKMILASFKDDRHTYQKDPSKGFSLVFLSVATSIDALAVGLSLAIIGIEIILPSLLIGITTAFFALLALKLGKYLSAIWGNKIEFVGGMLLIAIGIRILLMHLLD